jgi:siroheme synthase
MAGLARSGRRVVRIKDGNVADADSELEFCRASGIKIEVVPCVSVPFTPVPDAVQRIA